MNKSKLCLWICDQFLDETKEVLKRINKNYVDIKPYLLNCGHPQYYTNDSSALFKNIEECNVNICVGGCCIPPEIRLEKSSNNVKIVSLDQCFYMFTNKSMINNLLQSGSYLITPGWLKRWKNKIETWGFDKENARMFFKESCSKLVLLDTDVLKDSSELLNNFAEFVDRPFEIFNVGLDYYELFLKDILNESETKKITQEASAKLMNSEKKIADYSMALDLLGELKRYYSEEKIIIKIKEITSMLFNPAVFNYLPILDGNPLQIYTDNTDKLHKIETIERLENFNNKYALTESKQGFIISIEANEKKVGILEIDEVHFPDYINHYFDLAIYMVDIIGSAIGNARIFQKLRKTEAELATNVLDMFFQTNKETDIINKLPHLLSSYSNVEAIGIRLKKGHDFPYAVTKGFTKEFLSTENSLCSHVDNESEKELDCLCGKIISGSQFNFECNLSKRGSFWHNDLSEMKKLVPVENYIQYFHGGCITEGYNSLALIPIKSGAQTVGLLQLCDKKSNVFTSENIAFYEVITASISTLLERNKHEKEIQQLNEELEDRVIKRTDELQQALTKLQHSEKAIKEYSRIQNVLLKEVNHRVKNNLAALIGIIHKERHSAEIHNNTYSTKLLTDLIGRIRGLSTVHSLLSVHEWQPLHISEICSKIIDGAIQSLPPDKHVSVNVEKSEAVVSSDQAHNLAMVINEITTNSIKHTLIKRDSLVLNVMISQSDNKVKIVYKDDGPGYPKKMIDRNFSEVNVGFDIIRGVVEHTLEGTLNLENNDGASTIIIFEPNE